MSNFNKIKALAVLPISIGGRLTTSSIIDGLKQNSVDVTVFDELFEPLKTINNNFDIIVGYDFSPLELKLKHNLNAKCICYFSDEIKSKASGPNWKKSYKELFREDVYTFFWDKEMMTEYEFKNIFYLPHFVNFDLYKPNHKNKFDVMFAGRLDTDFRLNLFTSLMKSLPELNFAWYAIERHYQDALTRSNDKELIEKTYQGFIDNEANMANAINNSRILFNMNSQGISSLNYRTFQAVACKRLIISDYRKELELFNGYMPYWKNVNDLSEKILHYLSNETDYNRIVETCWEIGRTNHHSKENVEFMLSKVFSN